MSLGSYFSPVGLAASVPLLQDTCGRQCRKGKPTPEAPGRSHKERFPPPFFKLRLFFCVKISRCEWKKHLESFLPPEGTEYKERNVQLGEVSFEDEDSGPPGSCLTRRPVTKQEVPRVVLGQIQKRWLRVSSPLCAAGRWEGRRQVLARAVRAPRLPISLSARRSQSCPTSASQTLGPKTTHCLEFSF